jgi:TonB-linked SusC/RagA family outer membrane protein
MQNFALRPEILLRGRMTKTFLVMKLTVVFLLAFIVQASANKARSQEKINLEVTNGTLEAVLKEVSRQTGYQYMFQDQWKQVAKKINIHVQHAGLQEVLDICFANQPFTYEIVKKVIIIHALSKQTMAAAEPLSSFRATGYVYNESNQPLSGASVTIHETGKGTLTNERGEFDLPSVPKNATLIVSYVGYNSKQESVTESREFIFRLTPTVNELDRAVVQAYGVTTHRLLAGNIVKISADDIAKQPVMNPLLALEGRVPGLDVVQLNGFASAPLKVELRGRTSIAGYPSDPLYIIDGVPLTISNVGGEYATARDGSALSKGFLQTGGGFGGPADGQSPFFSLNPADIESIEILKDADATAIYGSRGANGVILITTKKGKAGQTKFDLSVQEGVTSASRFWPLLNTTQYLQMRREAFKNDNLDYTDPSLAGHAYDLLAYDTTRNIDWQKALYGHSGNNTSVQAAASGGDTRTTYRIGAGYDRVTNITTVNGADQRGSLSFDLQNHSINQKFTIGLTGTYSFAQSDMVSLPGIIIFPPDAPAIYDSAGNLNYTAWTKEGSYPFGGLKQPYTSKTNFLSSNLSFNYVPFKGLRTGVSLGYNNAQANQTFLVPISSQNPADHPTGSNIFGNNSNKNWIIEPQVSYDAYISKGKLTALVGGTIQHTTTDGTTVAGTGYSNDALLRSISNAPIKTANDNYGEYKYAAFFGRLVYSWENKYILSLNGRRDGSSRFGPGSQYGNFGSVGAAWIFSEESWMKKLPVLSFGKLRGSFGTTGSDAVGDYAYLTRWSSIGTNVYGGIQPLSPLQLTNPYYHWQVNKKLELGLDLGFLNDRFALTAAWYRNRCDNQLISFPTPALSGFTSVTANSPALVQNTGLEFTINAKLIDKKDVSWYVNFNTAFNRNKLIAYPNLAQSPFAGIYKIGSPLNMTWVFHSLGVDPQTGKWMMEDKNHDGSITYNFSSPGTNDDVSVLDLTPKFFGGIGTGIRYKTLQVDLFFTVKKQLGRNAYDQGNIVPGAIANFPVSQLDGHWQQPGDHATSARFTNLPDQTDANYLMSDGVYTDASYIRLSNLAVSYALPGRWANKAGMQGCNLFIHANNLFVITGYKGIDPETQNFGGLPPIRTVAGGISFNF